MTSNVDKHSDVLAMFQQYGGVETRLHVNHKVKWWPSACMCKNIWQILQNSVKGNA